MNKKSKLKLTVFMPHKNRATLALKSVPIYRRYLDIAPFDYEIIICDDHSEESEIEMLSCLIGPTVKLCKTKDTQHSYNMVLSMNEIAEHATGDVFLLTSTETIPINDIFVKKVHEITPKKCIVGSCLALGPFGSSRFLTTPFERLNAVKWHEQNAKWYQHSKHNNRQFNFFSLIHQSDWHNIGGFNTAMKDTYAYDDVDFLKRLKDSGTQIISDDEIMSVHLHHYLNGDVIFKNDYIQMITNSNKW